MVNACNHDFSRVHTIDPATGKALVPHTHLLYQRCIRYDYLVEKMYDGLIAPEHQHSIS